MADKEEIIKEKLEHSGIWDFKGFYKFAHSWLEEEDYDVEEQKYSETVAGQSRNINFEWKATKSQTDYFKNELKVKFEVKELTEVEVEIDGKKKRMNKGKISVEIKGTLISDKEGKWDATPFYQFIKQVYTKYVVPARTENMQSRITGDVIGLKEELKSFLELSGKRN